jgi:signal transduction histidine kinase
VLHVDTGTDPAASCPDEAGDCRPDASIEVPVIDRDERLGTIAVQMPAGRNLRGHDTQLLLDLANQSAIAFRNARLTAELAGQVDELRLRTDELVASRQRLITAGDAERRRLERAISRDVVAHLEPLPAALDRLAQDRSLADAEHLATLVAGADAALEALREITRGVFPAQLVRGGLGAALASYLGRSGSRGHLAIDTSAVGRFDPRAEAAAYFCVVEAAQNLQPPVEVAVAAADGRLVLRVAGRPDGEVGMSQIRDRVEAAGGTVTQETRGDRTVIDVRLPATTPIGSAQVPVTAASS